MASELGYTDCFSGARVAISIREWLPVACQAVGFAAPGRLKKEARVDWEVSGLYKNNASEALFTPLIDDFGGIGRPPGAAAFTGKILLSTRLREESEGAFKWNVAHELTHAFDTLR